MKLSGTSASDKSRDMRTIGCGPLSTRESLSEQGWNSVNSDVLLLWEFYNCPWIEHRVRMVLSTGFIIGRSRCVGYPNWWFSWISLLPPSKFRNN